MNWVYMTIRLVLFLGLFLSEQDRMSQTGLNAILSILVCLSLFEYNEYPLYYLPLWPMDIQRYPPSTMVSLAGLVLLHFVSVLGYQVCHRMKPRRYTRKIPSPTTWAFVWLAALLLLGPVRFSLFRNGVSMTWISVPLVLLWPQTRKTLIPVSYLFCWFLVATVHYNGPLISSLLFVTTAWLSLDRWKW